MKAREFQEGVGSSGRFGEIFIVLGILIGLFGAATWVLSSTGFWDDSPVGATAVRGDWIHLGFLFVVEGLGFVLFGVMALVAGWDRHHGDLAKTEH